jgi:hypothetical protein
MERSYAYFVSPLRSDMPLPETNRKSVTSAGLLLWLLALCERSNNGITGNE